MAEVLVRRQHRQAVAYAQLSQKGIDRSDLHAVSSAVIPEFRRRYVIVAVWRQQRDRGKPVENQIARFWP